MSTEYRPPIHRKLLGYAIALTVFLVLAAIWRFTPVRQYLNLARIVALGRTLRGHPAAPLLVWGGYLVGALLFFPMTLMLSATALIFDPVTGFVYGYVGGLTAAAMTYGIGCLLRRPGARWLAGPRLSRIRNQLQHRGLLAIVAARLLPVGNFTVINLAAGILMIRWRDFLIGNLVGLLPGVLVLTLFAGRLRTTLRDPAPKSLLILAALGVAILIAIPAAIRAAMPSILGTVRRWIRRRIRRRGRTPPHQDSTPP